MLFVTPGLSMLFTLVMLRVFSIVVEAMAEPVNTVPPIREPVPSVEEATFNIGSIARDSVVVALTSITGRGSFSLGGGAPCVMSVKSVLSVLL